MLQGHLRVLPACLRLFRVRRLSAKNPAIVSITTTVTWLDTFRAALEWPLPHPLRSDTWEGSGDRRGAGEWTWQGAFQSLEQERWAHEKRVSSSSGSRLALVQSSEAAGATVTEVSKQSPLGPMPMTAPPAQIYSRASTKLAASYQGRLTRDTRTSAWPPCSVGAAMQMAAREEEGPGDTMGRSDLCGLRGALAALRGIPAPAVEAWILDGLEDTAKRHR